MKPLFIAYFKIKPLLYAIAVDEHYHLGEIKMNELSNES